MAKDAKSMHQEDWLLLVFLSLLWGGSFFFNGVALRDLPPLTIAFARVGFAAVFLLLAIKPLGGRLPRDVGQWVPFCGMGLLNNVIPFSLFLAAQTMISSGMAAVLNATTPLFTVLVLGAFGEERLTGRRIAGVLIGLAGVALLRAPGVSVADQALGIVLCLGGALSYGFSGLWGRRMLADVPPITAATGQLISSAIVMAVIAGSIERPWQLSMPSLSTWAALIGLSALSTSLAYLVFFRILNRSGATNVMLVTLLIPVTAILLGHFILGEALSLREIVGAAIIGSALLVIDGRALAWLRRRFA